MPNFNRVTNLKVRQALAAATDRAGYSAALGGDKASKPSQSIVNPATPGYVANPDYSADGKPDIEGAKQLLQDSGETLPYPIKLTYPIGSDATDKAFAALKASYDQAGFQVTLDGLDPSGPYYDTIQKPGSDSDLIWGGWGADWPSVSTVIPPLFDSRINISKASNGQDYGNYKSDAVNAAMDAAAPGDRPRQGQPAVGRHRQDARRGRCLHPAGHHAVLLPARLQHRELHQLLRHQRVRRPRLHRSQEQLTRIRVPTTTEDVKVRVT